MFNTVRNASFPETVVKWILWLQVWGNGEKMRRGLLLYCLSLLSMIRRHDHQIKTYGDKDLGESKRSKIVTIGKGKTNISTKSSRVMV